jgi:hypothetical protein
VKKLAIGCGLVLLLTGMAAAGVAYYLYRQVSSSIAQFADLARVPDIERAIRNRAPFVPPASAELSDAQVEQLVRIQSEVRKRLGEQMAAFDARYKDLIRKDTASLADAPAILRAYGDLATAWLDAKRAQVDALNAAGLSLEEYRWIREQAYRALGAPFVDFDIAKLVEDARRGIAPDPAAPGGAPAPEGPESNRTRVERVRKLLEENLALASFGL